MSNILTVIIPIYKIAEPYLCQCLDSLICQSNHCFDIILIDDGSPDNCGTICDQYAIRNECIKVVHQANKGVSIARNVGIQLSNTEWITFIDPDDWVEPFWAESIINAIDNHGSGVDIFFFDYYQNYAKTQKDKCLYKKEGLLSADYVEAIKIAPFDQFYVNGKIVVYETNVIWDKVYRSSLIKDASIFFDPEAKKGQDVIFNAEILQTTNRFYYINKRLYHYRYLKESITNRYNPKITFFNEIAFKHYERIIKQYSLGDRYWKAFYARILTRIYSSMRLYYFHPNNKMNFGNVKKELNDKLNSYPYNIALKEIDTKYLGGTYKIFIYFLKKRNYIVLWLLVKLRHFLFYIKGARLK